MLRDDAVSRVKRRLLFRTNLDSAIVEAMQDAQQRLESEAILPWFLMSEVSSINTVSGEERVPLPVDFLRERDEDGLWYFNSAATDDSDVWLELAKDDLDDLRRAYPGEGAPKGYALMGDYLRLFPTPDAAYTLKMSYYKTDTILSSNIENDWLKYRPWLLIAEAGMDIALSIGQGDVAQTLQVMADQQRSALIVENTSREEAGRSRVKGGLN